MKIFFFFISYLFSINLVNAQKVEKFTFANIGPCSKEQQSFQCGASMDELTNLITSFNSIPLKCWVKIKPTNSKSFKVLVFKESRSSCSDVSAVSGQLFLVNAPIFENGFITAGKIQKRTSEDSSIFVNELKDELTTFLASTCQLTD